jgi:hypothetical protein
MPPGCVVSDTTFLDAVTATNAEIGFDVNIGNVEAVVKFERTCRSFIFGLAKFNQFV